MEIYDSLQKIIQTRKDHPVLSAGEYEIIPSDHKDIFIMKHYDENEVAYSISNFSNKKITLNLKQIIMTQNLKFAEDNKEINAEKFEIDSKDVKIIFCKL
jgi:glycosidase